VNGHRSGFAAVVGRPNVGKSTLVNRLVGEKVAIVSDKPQTTRHRIRGILTRPHAQVIFVDTPGLHRPRHRLGEVMVELARGSMREADVILFVVDATRPPGRGDQYIAGELSRCAVPVILVLNKVDLVSRQRLDEAVDSYRGLVTDAPLVPVSALLGHNLEELEREVIARLPEGPRFFPPEMVSDQPLAVMVAELIREKVLLLTREEVPHSVAVTVEEMARRREDLTYIRAEIHLERPSQKAILIGQGGSMLKSIGTLSREEIERLLGHRVYLDLWVRVSRGWRNREAALKTLNLWPVEG